MIDMKPNRPPAEQLHRSTQFATETPATPPATWATMALMIATMVSGLFAGFFLTYQMSVIKGLAIVDDATYVESFQAINATIRNPVFAVVFFGAAPTALWALLLNRRTETFRIGLLTLGLSATIATIIITFAGSIPLNDALALVDPSDLDAVRQARNDFESSWNLLNLIRTATAVVGFGAILGALAARQPSEGQPESV